VTLRVGLLHFTAPPIVGGVETVLGHQARLMADAGHRVRVIAGRGGLVDRRVELVRIPLADARRVAVRDVQRELDAGSIPAAFEALIASLVDDLRRATADLDVLVAHNVCSLNLNLPLTAALRRTVETKPAPRLIAWNHDITATSGPGHRPLHPGYPWDLFRSSWPGVIPVVVSEARRADLAAATGAAPRSIRVIPNGIDVEGFLGLHPTTRRLIRDLDLLRAEPVLLTPARVTPRKNLEFAIAVVAELRRAGNDARIIITAPPDPHDAGTRDYLAQLQALAAGLDAMAGVHFLADGPAGSMTSRVVADFYRVADALFLPSRDESFGLPILEAAACRLPVICADLPALRELAGEEATYVDPAGDPAAVAALVRGRLAGDRAHRLARRTRASFCWPVIFATLIEPLLLEAAAAAPMNRRHGSERSRS
jgi:glycosyltransferase involved in cell wall biosynthesis